MNCSDARRLLPATRDGSLPPREEANLAAHLSACAGCRRLHEDYRSGLEAWAHETATVAVPDPGEAWRELRSARRAGEDSRPPRPAWFRFGLPLAAAAALAVLFAVSPWTPFAGNGQPGGEFARVNYVEPGLPGASTLVYEDGESGWLVIWTSEAEQI